MSWLVSACRRGGEEANFIFVFPIIVTLGLPSLPFSTNLFRSPIPLIRFPRILKSINVSLTFSLALTINSSNTPFATKPINFTSMGCVSFPFFQLSALLA